MNYNVAFISLGCAKNQVNCEQMMASCQAAGHQVTTYPEGADVAVVNTCGFLSSACEEAIEHILELGTLKQEGKLISAGTRINWNGTVKKAAVDLWDNAENNPDNAPSLWQDIEYREGYRIIPDTITVTTAFSKGELGWWNGVLYRSLSDGNVFTPDVYPDGWERAEA